jgi:hypothetical protein
MNRKEFLLIIIITFIVVMVWVASNIYHDRSNTNIDPEIAPLLEDITPNFDQETLDKVKKITPLQTSAQAQALPSSQPSSSPLQAPTPATSSSQITPPSQVNSFTPPVASSSGSRP